MIHRWICCPLLILAGLLLGSGMSHATDLPLEAGVTNLNVTGVNAGTTVDELFADSDLPAADTWKNAPRLIETTRATGVPRATWRHRDGWRGTLDYLRPGSYWLVLPPGTPTQTLSLPEGVILHAGQASALYRPATGWTITPGAHGSMDVKHGPLPSSSGSYSVSDTVKTRWSAKGSVAIQDPPSGGVPGYIRIDLGPFSQFEGDVLVPMPSGGQVTVPAMPDFSTPPWGDDEPE